jgi:hypothetical protein
MKCVLNGLGYEGVRALRTRYLDGTFSRHDHGTVTLPEMRASRANGGYTGICSRSTQDILDPPS